MNKLKVRKIYSRKLKTITLSKKYQVQQHMQKEISNQNVKAKTTFFLIIDNIIIQYIQKCTEAQVLHILQTK
ncbi:hypothetical protein V1478_000141 [Vespula squamosa]|uniref:Uncharacterized protein n=1 Tax=Vespula squamosa TaxID=30214 RepID=A0ABD2C9E6_VESSQ